MKIAIRMLGIATIILWLVILFFSVTAVYSVMNLGVNLGEVQMRPSIKGITFSLPFSIDNNGYYEIADLNLTTQVTDPNETLIDLTETFVQSIPRGTTVNSTHTMPIDLDSILSLDYLSLLFEDSEFNVEIFVGLNFARAVPVQLSTNATIPWGAPLANLSFGNSSVSPLNSTHAEVSMPFSFENHAILDLTGTLKLELYNDSQMLITSGETVINALSQQKYSDRIVMYTSLQDALKLTGNGRVHVIFWTPLFTMDWWDQYG
jgi:hypothetical protein